MSTGRTAQFKTDRRIHIALAVRNVAKSTSFYAKLLGQPPTKERPDYAKFEVADPPLNLALNQTTGVTGPVNPVAHSGIQVKSNVALQALIERLRFQNLEVVEEENVVCCYATQNKAWVRDPDGNAWEVFFVVDAESDQDANNLSACCSDLTSTECCGATASCCE